MNAAVNNTQAGMQVQMVLQICGAERGVFKAEDGKEIPYGSVYGGQSLVGENAVGFKADKYKAESHVYEVVKGYALPAQFLCKVSIRQVGVSGQSIRILDAVPFEHQSLKANK